MSHPVFDWRCPAVGSKPLLPMNVGKLAVVHQVQIKEIQAAHAQEILRLKTEYEHKQKDSDM